LIARSTIQKVNDIAEILDVIGSFIQLKKRGANYLGNCPFHGEKTPSFTVSASKGIYKCFGCGKAGNVITFLQEHEKLTYPEAIVWLAKRYNIEVEETVVSNETKALQQVEESLRIINTKATEYFSANLKTDEGNTIGLSYFKERGLLAHTIERFQLGYALESREALYKEFIQNGFTIDMIAKAGLVVQKNDRVYDNYSGRVIFPIHNQSGKVIGFGARILKSNDKAPKYINTPENEVYNKSKTLYGIYFAKATIAKLDECYLVEGYTDVISLHQSGIENVVASSGTSLTEEQLKLIKRFTKNITILYDGDAAGVKAALRGLDMAIEYGLNVKLVLLPDNHDPDSYVQNVGATAFTEYITKNKKDIILFKLEATLKEANDDTVKKAALINDIAETISKINKVEEFTKQQDYIRRCAQLLSIDEAGLINLVNKKIREKAVKNNFADKQELETLEQKAKAEDEDVHQQIDSTQLLQKDYIQEKGLVRVLIEYGDVSFDEKISIADYIRLKIDQEDFINDIWKNLYKLYFTEYEKSLQFPPITFFTDHTEEKIRSAAIEAIYFAYELSVNWMDKHNIATPTRDMTHLQDVKDTVTYFQLRKIRNYFNEVLDELKTTIDEHEIQVIQLALLELKKSEQELLQHMKIVAVR
jgi:DNA primase